MGALGARGLPTSVQVMSFTFISFNYCYPVLQIVKKTCCDWDRFVTLAHCLYLYVLFFYIVCN